jgi:hypothetical protein
MTILIGSLLMLYGIGGAVLMCLIYLFLIKPQGLVPGLNKFLTDLVDKLQKAHDLAVRTVDLSVKGDRSLQDTRSNLTEIRGKIGEIVGFLNPIVAQLSLMANALNGFSSPTVSETSRIDLGSVDFDMDVVTGVNFDALPPSFSTDNVGIHFDPPDIPVYGVTTGYPLQPIGGAILTVNAELQLGRNKLNDMRSFLNEMGTTLGDAIQDNNDLRGQFLKPLPGQIDEVKESIIKINKIKLFKLILLLILGYFALMHLAFAAAGFGLMFA